MQIINDKVKPMDRNLVSGGGLNRDKLDWIGSIYAKYKNRLFKIKNDV